MVQTTSQPFDVAVIGAGPAGSTAALHAARGGRSVCLIERKSQVGVPVRCGEAFGLKGFSTTGVTLNERWVRTRITSSRLIAPDSTVVEYSHGAQSVVVDRQIMDSDLAAAAVEAGAELLLNTPIISIAKNINGIYECVSLGTTIRARCLIIADGIESRCARFLGWRCAVKLSDIECCAFGRITDSSIPQDACSFYFGSAITTAGYAWVFPRGNGQANVGLGILGTHTQAGKPQQLLQAFVGRHFPHA
ncbi:MAG: NAD(P)/FAD-dependent oxidoreductase, partial [Chitinivibrionales bacterium]|nr:NAD(P)/FAD-dependent oxidoreductase [Chitinivibrionales bacterium]